MRLQTSKSALEKLGDYGEDFVRGVSAADDVVVAVMGVRVVARRRRVAEDVVLGVYFSGVRFDLVRGKNRVHVPGDGENRHARALELVEVL